MTKKTEYKENISERNVDHTKEELANSVINWKINELEDQSDSRNGRNNNVSQPNENRNDPDIHEWEQSSDNQDTKWKVRDYLADHPLLTVGATGGPMAYWYAKIIDRSSRHFAQSWLESLHGVELSKDAATNFMNANANVLRQHLKAHPKMPRSMKLNYRKAINRFYKLWSEITDETMEATQLLSRYQDIFFESWNIPWKIHMSSRAANKIAWLADDEIKLIIKNSNSVEDLQSLLKARGITVSKETAWILKQAGTVEDFRNFTKICKSAKGARNFVKWLKWACCLSLLFFWFDIWAAIDANREADMIEKVNPLQAKHKRETANEQLWIWVTWVFADAALYCVLEACAYFWVSTAPRWTIAALAVAAWSIARYSISDAQYDIKAFYDQNRIQYSNRSRTYIKQSIVQLIVSDDKELKEKLKKEIREYRLSSWDSESDTLEDAREALIFQEENQYWTYNMVQAYYSSWETEDTFLEHLSDEEKSSYLSQKEELEWIIKTRMDYIKKFIKKWSDSPEYRLMLSKIESNQWISFVEQVLADSKVYASLQWDMEDPYIENYKDMNVADYKQAYRTKLKNEYPEEFDKFEQLSQSDPILLNEILSYFPIYERSVLDDIEGTDATEEFDEEYNIWDDEDDYEYDEDDEDDDFFDDEFWFDDWESIDELKYTDTEIGNIKKNLDFLKKYSEYYTLGRPIEKKYELYWWDENKITAYIESILIDNFQSLNKRYSYNTEQVLTNLSSLDDKNNLNIKFSVSDNLRQNILYSIATEVHWYDWINDEMELIYFYNENDKYNLWIYYDNWRRINKYFVEDHYAKEIDNRCRPWFEQTVSNYKKWFWEMYLDSDAEAADDKINLEIKNKINYIIDREADYIRNKCEYEYKIIDFINENSVDNNYVELPYSLIVAAKKAGIWDVENFYFKKKDGKIYALTSWDKRNMVLNMSETELIYESTSPLREALTNEEDDLIKSVDAVYDKLKALRSVEADDSDGYKTRQHDDELIISIELERIMTAKMQERRDLKDSLYYMTPFSATEYLKNNALEYYSYFDWLYRWLLTTITSFKIDNDIRNIWYFDMAQQWIWQFPIVFIDNEWNYKFHEWLPETIAQILPELFDFYNDEWTWKTVKELLYSEKDDEKLKWQFLARWIYTVCIEEAVLSYKNWKLDDFNVNRDDNLDTQEIKNILNDRMKIYTFWDSYNNIDYLNTEAIETKDQDIITIKKWETEFHHTVQESIDKIIHTVYDVDWGPQRWTVKFEADDTKSEPWKIIWKLNSRWYNENIIINIDPTSEKITNIEIPWLGMNFSNSYEWFRVANLINWIKNNKRQNPKWSRASYRLPWCEYEDYMRRSGGLDRNITRTTNNVIVLYSNTVATYYNSIKDSQKFLDYINSNRV